MTTDIDSNTDTSDQSVETSDNSAEVSTDTHAEFEMETQLQAQDAVQSLSQVDGIQPEAWQSLDSQQRLDVLQNVENHMADIQDRPSVPIAAEDMRDNIFGGYDNTSRGISINASHLASDMPIQVFVDTIVHEGRHAFQDYAVNNPGILNDSETFTNWAENMKPENYIKPEDDPEGYKNQPIEADAWNYASNVVHGLYGA